MRFGFDARFWVMWLADRRFFGRFFRDFFSEFRIFRIIRFFHKNKENSFQKR